MKLDAPLEKTPATLETKDATLPILETVFWTFFKLGDRPVLESGELG